MTLIMVLWTVPEYSSPLNCRNCDDTPELLQFRDSTGLLIFGIFELSLREDNSIRNLPRSVVCLPNKYDCGINLRRSVVCLP